MAHDFSPPRSTHPADPASFQLLSVEPLGFSRDMLCESFESLHPTLRPAAVDWRAISPEESAAHVGGEGPPARFLGSVRWADHAVKLIGFDAPMPPGPVSGTLGHSLFVPPAFREIGKTHAAHVLLYYAGANANPLEQFVALGSVAAALARFGCVVTLNEEARAAVPTSALLPEEGEDLLETLRGLPVPFLYGGLTRIELSDTPDTLWFRTFSNHRLGLPNLAAPGTRDARFSEIFEQFASLLNYLRETGLKFEPGETVRVDEDRYFKVRRPKPEEWWLDSDGEMLILEST